MMYERFLRNPAQGSARLRGCYLQASFDAGRRTPKAATVLIILNCHPSSESSVTVRSVSAVQWVVTGPYAVIKPAVKTSGLHDLRKRVLQYRFIFDTY